MGGLREPHKSALQHWREAEERSFGLNRAFLEVQQGPNPLTPEEVDRLIDRNPDRYRRFACYGAGRHLPQKEV